MVRRVASVVSSPACGLSLSSSSTEWRSQSLSRLARVFREKLAKAGVIEKLFDRFDQHLGAKGYIARGGQIVDATIVPVPKQRNTREENEAIKGGQTPKAWEKKPAKNRQKDKDARWTKKHGRSFYGYKNHVNADATHKLIRRYDVSDAAVHDSQKLDGLLNKANTSADVFRWTAWAVSFAAWMR